MTDGASDGAIALRLALSTQGTAFVVIVGFVGTPGWQLGRALVVVIATTFAVWAIGRGGRIARGSVALIAGILGTVVGAGIGVMHVVKHDPSVVAWAALVALITGIALLAYGFAVLTRSAHGWWRLLALPAAYLLFQFVLVPFTVAVYGTNAPGSTLGSETPADHGLAFKSVVFTTADHVRLSGWYIPSRNGAAIVLMHGSGETRSGVLDHARVLAHHGYGVLLFDARGHGRSGGDANEFGWYGNRDVTAAVSFVEHRPDVRDGRIAALGESMGGEEAIGAAAADTRLRAVVAEGALWRVPADAAWLPHTPQGLITRAMTWIQAQVTQLLSGAPQPIGLRDAVVATAPRPVLLIAGNNEIEGDRGYRDASPTNVQLWEMPDTAHTRGLAMHPAEWELRVTQFLDRALHPAPM